MSKSQILASPSHAKRRHGPCAEHLTTLHPRCVDAPPPLRCNQILTAISSKIVSQQRYNKSVDWYALGVLIYEMLAGLPPYHQTETNHLVLYEKIMQGPRYIRWPTAFHENATDLIMRLMESDPSRRYGNLHHGAGDVFAHPWFREVIWDKLSNREIPAPYLPRIQGDGDASAYVPCCSLAKPLLTSTRLIGLITTRRITSLQHTGCLSQILSVRYSLISNIPRP